MIDKLANYYTGISFIVSNYVHYAAHSQISMKMTNGNSFIQNIGTTQLNNYCTFMLKGYQQ